MAVEAIIFDWYGTLAAPNNDDFWTRMPQMIEAAGGHAPPISEWETIPIEHESHSLSEDAYRAWEAGRLRTLFTRSGIPEPARSALVEEISGIRYGRLFNVFPDVPGVLTELRGRGLPLGVCSNWDWDLDRHLHHNKIHDCFDTIVCSASVGFRKPHPRIFATVIDRMGIQPEKMLFVGDSWSDDVEGAAAAGFQTAHIARSACTVAEHTKALCLEDLRGLLEMV
jgi:putative hydrolase of the HAD superfamily